MRLGPKTRIKLAISKVTDEIQDMYDAGSGLYSTLAGEGYSGGYRQALSDVLLVLNGVKPNTRDYWNTSPDPI